MDELKKSVDESWKTTAEKEKDAPLPVQEKEFVPPTADFKFFTTTLAIQASIFLGVMPNPATNKTEEDPVQAKFLIDTLGMLQEKTKGNLTKEETDLLENILYELRMHYIAKGKEAKK